jgi:halocyanin-like protein
MSDQRTIDRRTVLRGIGGLAVAGGLAGCGGGSGGGSGGGVEGYLSQTGNFDSIQDLTGNSSITVSVGSRGNGGHYAFSPAAIRIETGTSVTWEWTGRGSQHNVVHEGGDFESALIAEQGYTFEHTFQDAGEYLYYCTPHLGYGMKGAIVVE